MTVLQLPVIDETVYQTTDQEARKYLDRSVSPPKLL
jgi:hypothetical protein